MEAVSDRPEKNAKKRGSVFRGVPPLNSPLQSFASKFYFLDNFLTRLSSAGVYIFPMCAESRCVVDQNDSSKTQGAGNFLFT
jgi:hypothetical protein